MDPTAAPLHMVALPFPGRGHVNAMLSLCHDLQISAGGHVLITFVVTEDWLYLLGPAARRCNVDLRFRTIPNVIPSEQSRGADIVGFVDAVFTKMEGPFEELLNLLVEEERQGEPPLSGIISDTFLPWAVAVGNRREIPVYSFFTSSACLFWVFSHIQLIHCNGQPLAQASPGVGDEKLDYVPGMTSLKKEDFSSVCSLEKSLELSLYSISWVSRAQCLLLSSCYELEPRLLEALQQKLPLPVHAVGPSIPRMALHGKPDSPTQSDCADAGSNYLNWLDTKPRRSVLFISLGSFLFVTGDQMDEIARGVRVSGVRFLWVVRQDAARMQELGGSAGLVVPWCNQLKVLCHPAVGGFLTHCGWNSTLEAVYAGVPMLTLPIIWDQPPNSRLIVDEWKIGLSMRAEATTEVAVGREEIARIVQRLMDPEGEESKELRRRAGELKESCGRAVQLGGSSRVGLDALVAHMHSKSQVKVCTYRTI